MISAVGEGLSFLLSVPRSGSTLLATLLNRHPDVLAPPEPWLMLAVQQIGRVCLRHPANSQLIGTAVSTFQRGNTELTMARQYASGIYNKHLAASRKKILIDKTPRYFHILDYLQSTFPRAKFIVLVRNPLDIAASYKASWDINLADRLRTREDCSYNFDWVVGTKAIAEFVKSANSQTYLVRYEELVANPGAVLVPLLRFIGADPDQDTSVNSPYFGPVRFEDGQLGDRNIMATDSVHNSSVGNWRRILPPRDAAYLAAAVGRQRFVDLGYGASADELAGVDASDAVDAAAEIERLTSLRWADVERVSTTSHPLPDHTQSNVRDVLRSDASLYSTDLRDRARMLETDHHAHIAMLDTLARTLSEVEAARSRQGEQITHLSSRLQEAESQCEAYGSQLSQTRSWLREAETDRANRVDQVAEMRTWLKDSEADRVSAQNQVASLNTKLAESNTDRAARLDQINQLTSWLHDLQADHLARGNQITQLTDWLQSSEADRSARGTQITELLTRVRDLEATRASRGDQIADLMIRLQTAEAERTARGHHIETLSEQLNAQAAARKQQDKEAAALSAKLQASENERIELGDRIKSQTFRIEELTAARDSLTAEVQAITAEQASLADALEAPTAEVQTIAAEQAESLESDDRGLPSRQSRRRH